MLSFGRSLTEQGFSKLCVGSSVEDPASIDSKSKHLASFKSAHFFQPASKVHILNIKAGGDVIGSIQTYLSSNKIEAANIMSAVGTLRSVTMRLAYCDEGKGYPTRTHHGKKQKYQLISLSGCLSMHGARLSVCIGDNAGTSHVGQLVGNMIAHDHVEICTQYQPEKQLSHFFLFFHTCVGLLEIAGACFQWPQGEAQMGELQVSATSAASEKGANPSPRCSPVPSPRTPTAAFHRRA
jgi:predicted DNA-binding protein with PD1-like motif